MVTEAARSFRGWVYAAVVAFSLILIFFAGENFSKIKKPGYFNGPRTTTLSVTPKPKLVTRMATEAIPLAIEPIEDSIDRSTWLQYRQEPQTSIALLEPPAGARLSAPIASSLSDPFNDALLRRDASALASDTESATGVGASTVSATIGNSAADAPAITLPTTNADTNFRRTMGISRNWPESQQLADELQSLDEMISARNDDTVAQWSQRVQSTLSQLRELLIHDDQSHMALSDLAQHVTTGAALSKNYATNDPTFAGAIARMAYAIERRHAVWASVHQCVRNSRSHLVAARKYELDIDRLNACLTDVKHQITSTGDSKSWRNYLMLDSLESLAAGSIEDRQEQVSLAREFLARVTDMRVSEQQRNFLTSASVHKLADQMHPLTIGPVDYRKVLIDIETLESHPVHRCGYALAEAMQSLRFSEYAEQVAVAQAIGMHYRNANLRISVSEEFVNRMMPKPRVIDKPVRQSILGADTRGTSQIATQLQADFLPDPTGLRVALNLDGDISSNTRSSRSGATFYNSSIANVKAQREVHVTMQGVSIDGQPSSVQSNDALRKFSTEWDSLPLFGDMVRYFAHEQFVQSRPIAKRIMQRTIAKQTDEEFDSQLQSKVSEAKMQFNKRLLGPLQTLDLQPTVMDMQTTDTRMIVRYRVASPEQIAAYTPRPLAPGDSQLSLQVHQSAINNPIGQVVIGNHDWSVQELADKIADVLQQPRQKLSEETPTDIKIRFVNNNPITVEFEDGRLWLTLRIESLEQVGRIHLKKFTVRTSYLPSIDGLKAELIRDGVISIDGPRLVNRDRFPIRAIFTKVFSDRSTIPMVSDDLVKDTRAKGLAVSQLEMRDGWLAIAVSGESSPHVATLKAAQQALNR